MQNSALEKPAAGAKTPERIEQATFFTPLVDIIENNEEFLFQADLPGVKPGDIDIRYDNGVLTLDGKLAARQPENTAYLWQEYGMGRFHRQFELDTPVNVEGIRAEFKLGELTLHVPKAEAAKPRKIQITAG